MPDIQLQVGVKVLLRDAKGRFLMLHRSLDKYPEVPHPWEIPGGRIKPGMPLLENLQREVEEETGLTVSGIPQLIDAQDILRKTGRHIVRLTYLADAGADEAQPKLSEEHTEFQWMSLPDILKLDKLDRYLRTTLEAEQDRLG